jgi:hypothetical protein
LQQCPENARWPDRSPPVSCEAGAPNHVGIVEAPNEKAAEAMAIKTFDLDDEQRRRLVV